MKIRYWGADKSLARPNWKNNWKVAIFRPTRRSWLSRRSGWMDKLLNFGRGGGGLQKLEFGRCNLFLSAPRYLNYRLPNELWCLNLLGFPVFHKTAQTKFGQHTTCFRINMETFGVPVLLPGQRNMQISPCRLIMMIMMMIVTTLRA